MSGPIGFVGLGIMGKGMLKNLVTKLEASKFVVWNRNVEVCEEMKSLYPNKIEVATNACDVVKSCSITYSMLSTIEASIAVHDAPEIGLIAGVSPGKYIIDCATLSPERMMQQATAIEAKGGNFLEAPVSGSKVPAEMGQLIFLCGGDADSFAMAEPGFNAMGKAKFLFGSVGQGSRVKLVVNMIMGTMMEAFAEGIALGQATDIPTDQLLQVLDLGAMANPMFKMKGNAIINNNYSPNFPLKHAQKDMGLALALAEQKGISLPTTAAANEVYLKGMNEKELGDEDFCAVYKAI